MLIGIVYHVALSFAAGLPWVVQDVAQAKWPFVFQAWVHGFRMQLFMIVSGFFTAMLWRKKGLKAVLWQRCQRVLFPCLLGLITVVPAMNWAVGFAFGRAASAPPASTSAVEPASASLWAALQLGDLKAAAGHLAVDGSLTNLHQLFGLPPLQWAALNGQRDALALLLDRGAPVNGRSRDGHTALHGAAFMGHAESVRLLLERGADVNAASNNGETPLHNAGVDFDAVRYISGLLGLQVDQAQWVEGRKTVRAQLEAAGARASVVSAGPPGSRGRNLWDILVNQPVFVLIWFLWFLVWLIAIFAIYALLAQRFGWKVRSHWLILTPANLLWLVPLTLAPTALMGTGVGIGPDTSMGIIPMPHVLLYYVLFFFFGAIYYDCDDREGRLGASWRWMLPLTLLVVFPLALEFATGTFGFRDFLLPKAWQRPSSVLFQSLFAWMMAFSSIGLSRSLITRESYLIRYLSDSAYWLYLAHLPLCIAGQAVISQWRAPVWVKLPVFSLVLTAFLLLTYHFLVRYTWVGKLLNGPRKRPQAPAVPANATPSC
jgi:hypothetical protein